MSTDASNLLSECFKGGLCKLWLIDSVWGEGIVWRTQVGIWLNYPLP